MKYNNLQQQLQQQSQRTSDSSSKESGGHLAASSVDFSSSVSTGRGSRLWCVFLVLVFVTHFCVAFYLHGRIQQKYGGIPLVSNVDGAPVGAALLSRRDWKIAHGAPPTETNNDADKMIAPTEINNDSDMAMTDAPTEANNKADIAADEDIDEAMAYVRSFSSFHRPLIFFHIPKTAGTALEQAAAESAFRLAWGSCLFWHKPKRDICPYPKSSQEWPHHVGWWHLPASFFPLAQSHPYANAELFGVVRDPLERMVSEFYYLCTLKVKDWRPNQCERDKLLDPNYMNRWLRQKVETRPDDPTDSLTYLWDNGHLTPQTDYVMNPMLQIRLLDHVLRLDDTQMEADFERLMRAYGLALPPPAHRKNGNRGQAPPRRQRRNRARKNPVTGSGGIRLQKMNAISATARNESHLTVRELDNATIELLWRVYHHDFEHFNFPEPNVTESTSVPEKK